LDVYNLVANLLTGEIMFKTS